jgi:uncharacterized coiled-coil DUF342 family protein
MLDELISRRNKLVEEVVYLKRKVKEYNSDAIKWSSRRDGLNKRIKHGIEEAKGYKELRNKHNELIRENSSMRDELKRRDNRIRARIDLLREKDDLSNGPTINDIEREIDRLEFKQQTNVLPIDKERQLIGRISSLRVELKKKKEEMEENDELRRLIESEQKLRMEISEYHKKVVENLKLAQEFHDKMVSCFREVDRNRKEADEAHRRFLIVQRNADETCKKTFRFKREIRDFEKVIETLRRQVMSEDYREKIESRRIAEEIYSQFKQGEKLDTEDLLLLQRAGFL